MSTTRIDMGTLTSLSSGGQYRQSSKSMDRERKGRVPHST